MAKRHRKQRSAYIAQSLDIPQDSSPTLNRISLFLILAIAVLFFMSGMTGLIYEVTWTRMFTAIFGNTTYAVSAVLTAFMGGLALGSFIIGKFIDKKHHLLKIYGILELGIGLSALLMPLLLHILNEFYTISYQHLHFSVWQLLIIKTAMSLAVLLVPTFLMGGTLPVLSKFIVGQIRQSGTRIGLLYAVNTLGATLGCFLTGFLFIKVIGVTRTIQVAAAINFFLAATFFILGVFLDSHKIEESRKETNEKRDAFILPSKHNKLILIGFALAGFVSLSYEVLWTRLLVFKLHTTVYAFTIMLATFLIGIGLGSLIFSVIDKLGIVKNYYTTFGIIESLIGLFGLLSILLFGLFEPITALWETTSWHEHVVQHILLAGIIMIAPTLLMGIAFPLVSRLYTRNIKNVGTSIGKIYSANTTGCIFGSLLTGFLFVETLGTQKSIVLISLIALIVGTVILGSQFLTIPGSSTSKRVSLILLPLFWLAGLGFILIIPGNFLFRYYNIGEKEVNSKVKILSAYEGVECITTVHRYPDGNRVISTGSINVAGTDFTLRTTQKLQAHIPMLLHPDPKEVLQVGFGSGETSYILTTYETARVDVVEISKGVLKTASKYFRDLNQGVIHNPKFRTIIMDGANYIALTKRKYDVIMNDSIWPFYSGNAGLYTREYFEACKKHLKKGGIMTSWLPVELPEESLETLLKTFHSVFPYVSLWMAVTHYNKHALIVGSLRPIYINVDLFLKRFNKFARDDLKVVNLNDPIFFLNAFKMDQTGFIPWVSSAPLNTLDKPILEFAPQKGEPNIDRERSYELIANSSVPVISHLTNLESLKNNGIDFVDSLKVAHEATKYLMSGLVMREKGEGNFLAEFEQALKLMHNHPGARYLIDEFDRLKAMKLLDLENSSFNDLMRMGDIFLKNNIYNKAIIAFKKAAELKPSSPLVHYNLGTIYYYQGFFSQAISELNKSLKWKNNYAPAYNMLGLAFYAKGECQRAITNFNKAVKLNSEYAFTYNNRGIAFASKGQFRKALKDFNRAISLRKNYAEAYYNRGLVYQSGSEKLGLTRDLSLNKAIDDYSMAIKLNPTYINAYNNRGMIYAIKGQYRLAIKDFSKIIELNSDQADAYYNRGLAYKLSGNFEKAKKDFDQAIRLNPAYKKNL